MRHATRGVRRLIAALAACALSIHAAPAGDDAPPAREERAGRLAEMKRLVRPFRAAKIVDGRRVPLALGDEPLQRWNDPTREFSDGSLWIWGTKGRPEAAVAVELYANRDHGPTWSYEFVSLSTGLVEVEGGEGFLITWDDLPSPRPDGSLLWSPREPGLAFAPIPGAPAPGRSEAARMRQMKALAQRFSGDEYYEPADQNYTFRLLPHPVHRYADAPSGLIDGAIFLLAHGTNPEVLIFVEAQGPNLEAATWRYALARLSQAAPTARLDQKVVWSRPYARQPLADDPYFIARKPRSQSKAPSRPAPGEKTPARP